MFIAGMIIGAILGAFIICCLVAGNETELQMAQIIETYDNEVNRQYKVIKKAIEYIEKYNIEGIPFYSVIKEDLLNILQGSDKE